MLQRAMLFFLLIGLIGCSQQPGEVQLPTRSTTQTTKVGIIRSVWIEPQNPSSNTDLRAELLFRGERPERFDYQWVRNGTPIPGAISQTLSSRYLTRGDFISVQVRVPVSGEDRDPVSSHDVQIGNTPPVVDWVAIGPTPANSSMDLNAKVQGADLDKDLVSYSYQWIVNGETIVGQEGSSLPSGHFRRGDEVRVVAIPFDGTDWGNPASSVVLSILNSPPKIVSTPPERLEEGGLYRYEVQVENTERMARLFGTEYDLDIPLTQKVLKPIGEWNQYEVILKGPDIKVFLNGNLVCTSGQLSRLEPGFIGLQGENGAHEYRNIYIKDLRN